MTTSGNDILTLSRDQIILAAFRKMGIASEGENPQQFQINNAADDLNRIIKALQGDGVKLYAYDERTLFLTQGQAEYKLGTGSADICVESEQLITTTSSALAAAGATSITLTSTAGMSTGFNIGVLQDDNSLFWTTISALPGGNVVTLSAGLTVQASAPNTVYAYPTTAASDRPLRVEQARIQPAAGTEIPMLVLGRADYFAIPNKSADGTPIQFHYNPTLGQGSNYIWPVPVDDSFLMNMTCYRALDIFTSGTDTVDMPEETYQALIYALAAEQGMDYGLDENTLNRLEKRAQYWMDKAEAFDQEEASIIIMPDLR